MGLDERVALLRRRGKLLRDKRPDPEIVEQLILVELPNLSCKSCGHVGIQRVSGDDCALTDGVLIDGDGLTDEDWGEARRCCGCGVKIDPERLDILPDTTQCTACSAAGKTGQSDEREFCPRCGSVMRLAQRRGSGLAGYSMRCESCG